MGHEEPIGLLVAVVRRRIKQVVLALISDQVLSSQQFWTLVAVAEHEGLSLKELTERRRMDQPTASRVVSTLARRRLIRNATDPDDRRRSQLRLTPQGRALAERLTPIALRIRSAIEGGLTPKEREATAMGLTKVIASLDRFESSPAAARLTRASLTSGPRRQIATNGDEDAEE